MRVLLEQLAAVLLRIPFIDRFLKRLLSFVHLEDFFVVMHYGCPNSKRTERLQLKKRIFKLLEA